MSPTNPHDRRALLSSQCQKVRQDDGSIRTSRRLEIRKMAGREEITSGIAAPIAAMNGERNYRSETHVSLANDLAVLVDRYALSERQLVFGTEYSSLAQIAEVFQ